jgi:large subunit ribosomal protein L15
VKLHELSPAPGSRKRAIRVGRGRAGRRGKTAGHGTKGAKARAPVARHYEGGQVPLQMRIPELGGFKRPMRVDFNVVNLDRLDAAFEAGAVVDPQALRSKGLVAKKGPVKVLGRGAIAKPLHVKADAFSGTALAKIEAAGGTSEVLG